MQKAPASEIDEGAFKEEILLSKWDLRCGTLVSVKLLTYPDGTLDLFRQAGDQFQEHIAEATLILQERGLEVGAMDVMLCSGAYLPVWPKSEKFDAVDPHRETHLRLAMAPFDGDAALGELVYAEKTPRVLPLQFR